MRRPLLTVCICLFVSIAIGTQLKNPLSRSGDITGWDGQTILLTGQVYEKEYRVNNGEETLVLYLKSILYSTEAEASYQQIKQASMKLSELNPTEKLICEISLSELPKGCQVPALGSEVFLRGKWQSIKHATNPGEFDAANYYRIEGIGARLKNTELLGVGNKKWPVREALHQLKKHFLVNLHEAFPEKEASILAKMLLGIGGGLDEEVRELYQDNGIVHILSISGLHITLLGMGFYKLLRRLGCPMTGAAVCGGIMIVGYGIMTGFGISAFRAIGMYLLRMLGELWGRSYDMLTAMGVLAVIMLVDNPLLVYHSGFLLSFSSVCGVGLLSPLLQLPAEWFRKPPGEKRMVHYGKVLLQNMAGGLSVSLSVILFTLPIQLFFFYKIPIYSVFINLLVIPLMSIVMVVGIVGMMLPGMGFISPIEVWIFRWFEWLCHAFEKLPGHTWVIGRPAMWKLLMYYVLILGVIFAEKKLGGLRRLIGLGVLVLFMGLRESHGLKITVLDVGQGDCICVQTSQGECFLFDAGSSSRQNVGETVILPFLQYEGIDRIDGVFLSHGDMDHYSGIVQLLGSGEILIERLYLPDVGTEAHADFEVILAATEDVGVQYVSKGDRWEMDNLSLTCLHPQKGYEENGNAYSACYLLEEEGFSMLLTGDVEGQGEELLTAELKQRGMKEVSVLKVAHHGSKNATSQTFLDWLEPELAVISCGRNNSYGHPHAETLERLAEEGSEIMTTPQYGAITIEVDSDERFTVSYWGNGGWNTTEHVNSVVFEVRNSYAKLNNEE